MDSNLVTALFGLASAVAWGGGDFCGGVASRRAPILWVLTIGSVVGLLLLPLLAVLTGEQWPSGNNILWAIAAGCFGTFGLAMLYQGLAIGRSALIAPVSAIIAALLPVMVAFWREGPPSVLQLMGFGLALAGIWLVSQTNDHQHSFVGLNYAVLAGLGFGAFFVLIAQASRESTFWPLATARTVTFLSTAILLVGRAASQRIPRNVIVAALLAGLLDVGGNALYVLSAQVGRIDIAAVLSSFYPASTVLLSRVLLNERIQPVQMLGLAVVLVAIGLVVGG